MTRTAVARGAALAVFGAFFGALGAQAQSPNTLTPGEAQSGWKLRFDGKNLGGWHS